MTSKVYTIFTKIGVQSSFCNQWKKTIELVYLIAVRYLFRVTTYVGTSEWISVNKMSFTVCRLKLVSILRPSQIGLYVFDLL